MNCLLFTIIVDKEIMNSPTYAELINPNRYIRVTILCDHFFGFTTAIFAVVLWLILLFTAPRHQGKVAAKIQQLMNTLKVSLNFMLSENCTNEQE